MLYQQNSGDEHTDQLFLDFEEYEYGLENDFKQFKSNTTEPIWNLRYVYSLFNRNKLIAKSLSYLYFHVEIWIENVLIIY